jgi:hypothetical protein
MIANDLFPHRDFWKDEVVAYFVAFRKARQVCPDPGLGSYPPHVLHNEVPISQRDFLFYSDGDIDDLDVLYP